jgi:hypothetical protein
MLPAVLSPVIDISNAFVTDWHRFILVVSPRFDGATSGKNLKADA